MFMYTIPVPITNKILRASALCDFLAMRVQPTFSIGKIILTILFINERHFKYPAVVLLSQQQ